MPIKTGQGLELNSEEKNEDQTLPVPCAQHFAVRCRDWTLTKTLQRKLDGVFTRMLRKTLGLTWKDKVPNTELYGNIPSLSSELRQRHLRFAGYCLRRQEELYSQILMWEPLHGKRKRGTPARTYLIMLEEDTEMEREDLMSLMHDRELWRSCVDGLRDTPFRPK